MRQLLDEAAAGRYGVGAFNANNTEQIQGIVRAAGGAASAARLDARDMVSS
jgi:fructose/tagatose bisphosphate aldolase